MRAYKYCLRCGYYSKELRSGGVCKRYPPQIVFVNGRVKVFYPPVGRRSIDGCGEWIDNRAKPLENK